MSYVGSNPIILAIYFLIKYPLGGNKDIDILKN